MLKLDKTLWSKESVAAWAKSPDLTTLLNTADEVELLSYNF